MQVGPAEREPTRAKSGPHAQMLKSVRLSPLSEGSAPLGARDRFPERNRAMQYSAPDDLSKGGTTMVVVTRLGGNVGETNSNR